jgi:hypothetical protein
MTELVHIPFRGGEILAVDVNGRPHIVLRPALENIGLDYSTQLKKLQGRSWATVGQCPTVGADGRTREMITVDLRTFLMLLATVNESSVNESIRPTLVAYQSEVADAIEAYWTKGSVTRLPDENYAPRTLTLDEAAAVLQQRYGLTYTVPSLARALRNCGVFKQTGAPMGKFRWWFWFTGSTWNVHPHVLVQMARRLAATEQQLRAFDGIQMRLELEGVGQPELGATTAIST